MAHHSSSKRRFKLILLLIVLAVLAGAVLYLGLAEVPAPTQPVEREIPYEQIQPKSE